MSSVLKTKRQAVADAKVELDKAARAVLNLTDSASQTTKTDARGKLSAAEALHRAARSDLADAEAAAKRIKVIRYEPTYRPGGPHSWFRDVLNVRKSFDPIAQERLETNNREVTELSTKRDARGNVRLERTVLGQGASGGGFMVPIFMQEAMAGVSRVDRVFTNAVAEVASYDLPPTGVKFLVPSLSTGLSDTVQSVEAAANPNVDITSTQISLDLVTITAQQDIARQAIDRSSALDVILAMDLQLAYNELLEQQVINGDGSTNHHKGVLNAVSGPTTVTFASGDGGSLLIAIDKAISKSATARGVMPNCILMHPRRLAWLLAPIAGGAETVPNISQRIVPDPSGVEGVYDYGVCKLIASDGIPTTLGVATNQDVIAVLRLRDMAFAEAPPRIFRFEDVGSNALLVRLTLEALSVFTPDRRTGSSVCLVSGAGLAAVAGF